MPSEDFPEPAKTNWVLRKLPCIFVLSGGLGNQYFTYAAGLFFSEKSGRQVVFELSDTDLLKDQHTSSILKMNPRRTVVRMRFQKSLFNAIRLLDKILHLAFRTRVIYGSPGLGHDINLEKNQNALLVRGHFQTYKYFLDKRVSDEMKTLAIADPTAYFTSTDAELSGRRVLGVHVRLGNYSELQQSFGALSEGYFSSAIEAALTHEKSGFDYIYLYSEEIEKASQILGLADWGVPFRLIGKDSGLTDEETLALMSKSDSLVISNSTFSWWAAALGNLEKSVYAPAKWFRGMQDPAALYPPHWNLVESRWK